MEHTKKYYLKKTLSGGLSANPRPLYDSNETKVFIVKWSQILISTVGSSIAGVSKIDNYFL